MSLLADIIGYGGIGLIGAAFFTEKAKERNKYLAGGVAAVLASTVIPALEAKEEPKPETPEPTVEEPKPEEAPLMVVGEQW
jgi:hypothetical protein